MSKSEILEILSADGELALKAADAVIRLIREAAALGELPLIEVSDHGDPPRLVEMPPKQWFERLEVAARSGAFEKMTVEEIVSRILTTSAPEFADAT